MQTVSEFPTKLDSLYASCTAALESLQSVLPLQHTAGEICSQLDLQTEGIPMLDIATHST